MSFNSSPVQSLRRVFNDGFSTHDIASPLRSFDAGTPADELRAIMTERKLQVVGVRREGLVEGFVELEHLEEGVCGDSAQLFGEDDVVLDSLPLADLILQLRDRRRLFVSVLGAVGGIVSRTDLQKPAVRMWLFGMVTLIEMRFARMIEHFFPRDSWCEHLSPGRLAKANELLAERMRVSDQQLNLLDCLQFADKARIMARAESLREAMEFQSRRQFEEVVKRVERLRNNLAHAQDIVNNDWDTIVQLSENLDRILEGPAVRAVENVDSP